jgi:mannose-6-phosphate isomerase-like protein (cupin superfamily)
MQSLIRQVKSGLQQWHSRSVQPAPDDVYSGIYPMPLPLAASNEEPWKPCHFFRGQTLNGLSMSCHASALVNGYCPHPPHAHDEEELLLLLNGEAEITLPAMAAREARQQRLQPGQFVYYPALFPHTIRTISEEPANYLMFKWSSSNTCSGAALKHGQYQVTVPQKEHPQVKGYYSELLFEGPTRHLGKLHCHMTRLMPGSGYPAHVDHYDAAIVFLEGECESLGQHVGPNSILFYAAGEPHGLQNTGTTEARYLVFEFHPAKSRSTWSRLFRSGT